MKIKVIDILNTIARGEEPPKKIMYEHKCYKYEPEEKDYYCFSFDEYLFDSYVITDILNDEVEILQITIHNLETKKNNIIEKLEELNFDEYIEFANLEEIKVDIVKNRKKINEIIDHIQE